ncbi:MAG: sulfatase-like hydrolase/transferase [Bacteroidaceae bacterium]|nr:sulfatase-like hydrolase/transferase [Bacteroidaceae bacterium]
MKERVIFIARYYFSLVALSALYKVIFLFACNGEEPFSAFDALSVICYGLQHDLAVAGYFTAIPFLTSILTLFVKFRTDRILAVYNGIVAFMLTLAFLADISLFPYWGFKLDASVLMYLDSPANAFASVEIWHLCLLLMILAAVTYGIYRLLNMADSKELPYPGNSLKPLKENRWIILVGHILVGGLIFLGIRGGISESTNNIGTVYFSDRNSLNYAAVNPAFSFLYSFTNMEDHTKEYSFFEEKEREEIFNGLYPKDGTITDTLLNNTRPNIITIILEGLSANLVEELGGMEGVTPNFNRLAKEGVLFTNCYANSYRTDRGLICTLSGYPSFPKTSVMKSTVRSQKLPSLASELAKAGYTSTFVYGGDINFTNMRGYLYSTGYERIIADKDFSAQERATHRWGAGDDIVLERLYDVIAGQVSTPWHITCLTLSSHEPWTVPYDRIKDDKIANSFAFTDEEFGKFIERFRKSDKWDNTLIICISDHSVVGYPKGITQTDRNRNHIPLLLLGGAVKEARRIETLCNQQDLVATILPQLGLPESSFPFSRNILSPEYRNPFAYHCFNNGFSIIDSTGFSVYNLDNGKAMHEEPAEGSAVRLNKAKSILQTTYSDFINK